MSESQRSAHNQYSSTGKLYKKPSAKKLWFRAGYNLLSPSTKKISTAYTYLNEEGDNDNEFFSFLLDHMMAMAIQPPGIVK